MAPTYKRSRLWVNLPFQSRLLLRMVLYLVVFAFVLWHIGFVYEVLARLGDRDSLRQGFGQFYLESLGRQQPFLWALLLTLPALLYDLLKFSHRIAGPLYRCQKVLQQMAAGRPVPEFVPRKGDHMPEFFGAFNAAIREWNARLGAAATAATEETSPAPECHEAVRPQRLNA